MRSFSLAVASLAMLMLHAPAGAAVIGQVQTFDDPAQAWVAGVGPVIGVPTPIPTALGGPGGAADPYLSIVSTGGTGPGSRLSAQNFNIWAGDYLSAGITHLMMDVRNFGTNDVDLRLLFVQFGAMGPVAFGFTDVVEVPAGSDWQTVMFNVTPGALTVPLGTAAGLLANVDELRIFHNPDPFFAPSQMPAIVANIGVDNITAAAIPEPGTWSLLAAGLAVAALARRRRRS